MNLFLTIAASDTSGGAGIQQDIKVAEKLGYHTLSAITALTAQDFEKVYHVFPVKTEILESQISVLKKFNLPVCKIGVLANDEQIDAVASFLQEAKIPIVVLDTVFKSSSGKIFLDTNNIKRFKEKLLPLSTFITPNKLELECMLQLSLNSIDEAVEKAISLYKQYGCGIYIKGGHFVNNNNFFVKEAIIEKGYVRYIFKKRHLFAYSHGTGCTFSTAFALFLHKYNNPFFAAKKATKWVSSFYCKLNNCKSFKAMM